MDKKYDVGILGATGFTGKRVLDYWFRWQSESKHTFSCAVGGRDKKKLETVVKEVKSKYLSESDPGIYLANTSDQDSLDNFAKACRVVLNCVGPYRFHGEQVVKACVNNGADYLDITGEPEFIESMILKYHKKAKEANTLIVPSCGFDSVPADLGVIFTMNQMKKAGLEPDIIEGLITAKAGKGFTGNFATFESAVYGFANAKNLHPIRKKIESDPELSSKIPRASKAPYAIQQYPFFDSRLKKYAARFVGSDASVVRASQRFLSASGEKGPLPYFGAYATFSSIFSVILLAIFGVIAGIMTRFAFGRNLLLKYPAIFTFGYFTHHEPSQKAIDASSFTYDFYGSTPDQRQNYRKNWKLHTRVTGPEAGYAATPIIMVQAARVLLEERENKEKLPFRGGVVTPGAAFGKSSLESHLTSSGFEFAVVAAK